LAEVPEAFEWTTETVGHGIGSYTPEPTASTHYSECFHIQLRVFDRLRSPMNLRRLIFWSHLLVGITVGVVVLVMCVTGVLLTYEKQLIAWSERGMRSAPPPPNTPHLPVESLLTQLLEQNPSLVPTGITLYSDPNRPALVAATPATNVYVDPYTGALLAQGSPAMRSVFQSVTNWHRYFGASAANRTTGKSVNDASNLLFLFTVVSGIYLWWPRKVIWFQRGLLSKARNWN